jgi:hypothetical protein
VVQAFSELAAEGQQIRATASRIIATLRAKT